jgi:hypothetical protein
MRTIHNSKSPKLAFKNTTEQTITHKPRGLWYGVEGDDDWLHWCKGEMPEWIKPYNFLIEIDYSKMLVISTTSELKAFTEEYRVSKDLYTSINWPTVTKRYKGIEISPYQWSCRLAIDWYYGWDCASGCIWNRRAIKSITKLKPTLRIHASPSSTHASHPSGKVTGAIHASPIWLARA